MRCPVTVSASVCRWPASSRSRVGTPPASSKSGIRPDPDGSTSASTGTVAPSRAISSSGNGTPARPAIAARWMTALVEPPIACSATIALAKESAVRMDCGRRSGSTAPTASRPASPRSYAAPFLS